MDDITLEVYKLIIGADEIEAESAGTVSEYLIERAAFYGNKLGKGHKTVKEFDIVKDPYSDGWILIFMCERWF
tara:strand:- start:1069 stop:1287 length:219 start_codon:yes stop_codon:yes gene_type:complete